MTSRMLAENLDRIIVHTAGTEPMCRPRKLVVGKKALFQHSVLFIYVTYCLPFSLGQKVDYTEKSIQSRGFGSQKSGISQKSENRIEVKYKY